jgi:archaeal flagellin FlaB
MKVRDKSRIRKKGETGIGTLIVFIAMVLVAAIAASVLLGTGSSLQQRALTTGKQTEREVAEGIHVVMVSAVKDNSSFNGTDLNGSFSNYDMLVKLTSGSDPLSLWDTIITVDTTNTSQSFEYLNTGGGNTTNYNVSYMKMGPGNKPGYLSRGDIVRICFQSIRPVMESEIVKIRIIPKHGQVVPVDFYTPDVITTDREILYP